MGQGPSAYYNAVKRCKYPGCTKTVYVDQTGAVYDFCGRSHARAFATLQPPPPPHTPPFFDSNWAVAEDLRTKLPYFWHVQTREVCWPVPAPAAAAAATTASAGTGATAGSGAVGNDGGDGRGAGANAVLDSAAAAAAVAVAAAAAAGGGGRGAEPWRWGIPKDPMAPIMFYNAGEPFYEFTNFAPFPIVVDGDTWPTTEHYFQANKFIGEVPQLKRVFVGLPTPRAAFELSRTLEAIKRSDWESVKEQVMMTALTLKFTQHPQLSAMLLATAPHPLVEHSPVDTYWGDGGGGGRGRNRLGEMLMEIRQQLLDEVSRQQQQQQQQQNQPQHPLTDLEKQHSVQ